jgi:hypothetical protein
LALLIGLRRKFATAGGAMFIYLFRDESDDAIFAFSIDVNGANLPAVTPLTEWVFLEALDTLRFPDPWDITDFQDVLDRLKADGYYLFEGEFIEQPPKRKGRPTSLEC